MAKKMAAQHGSLPADFASHITRMVGVHLAAGNWPRAIEAVHAAERMWREREAELTDPATLTTSTMLSRHVSCLRLDARTVCQIDEMCCGTIGALLEVFPSRFIGLRGVGDQTIKTIASELCRIGAISRKRAAECVKDFGDGRSQPGRE
jgi:hypothetical protein